MYMFHKFNKRIVSNIFFITVLVVIAACSSKPVVSDFPPSASPADEILSLERDLNTARDKQVDILSPKNFKESQKSLVDAKKTFLNGKDFQQALHEVALGRAYLVKANSAAEVSRESIKDVITARDAAIRADAPKYYGSEFKNLDDYLINVTGDIEKNKMKSAAKERSTLKARYLDLEIKGIQEKNLRESRNVINLAKKEGARRYAPRTLAIAENSLADTSTYIRANPHNTIEINAHVKNTKDAAYHAYNINREAKGTAKVSHEEIAIILKQERDRAIKSESRLDTVQDELQTTQSALEKEKQTHETLAQTKEELAVENEKLAAEKSLNEKYEAARKKFSSNEADVYRQGENLLIRLKGMEFPSSHATIQSKKYPLLSKVEKVIEEFGPGASVTVEGHTDSVGGKTVNNRLSAKRAEAVKDYLQANGGGIDVNIETVGYGDQKPLATNKTASGRAQNRRVDIVIKPEATKL